MIKYAKPLFPSIDQYINDIKQVYKNGQFTNNGPFVQQLEMALKEYLDTDRHIIMVNSATSGLLLAIKALSLENKEILVPSFTFPATLGAIKWAGAKYRYIDIDINTYCIDDSLFEKEISNNSNIEAVIAINCFGNVCKVHKIDNISSGYNIKVIYDSAPALGSEIDGRKVGNFGDIEVFSLHATKILPIGEGGFLSVKNKDIAEKIRKMKNFGFDDQKNVVIDGLNFKLSEFSAIFGIAGLKHLDKYVYNRREYIKIYQEKLGDIKHIKFQKTDHCKSSYQGLTIRIDNKYRDRLFNHLIKNEIECKKYFDVPLHKTAIYRSEQNNLHNTDILSSQILSLPLYSVMNEEIIDNVTDKIIDYFIQSK